MQIGITITNQPTSTDAHYQPAQNTQDAMIMHAKHTLQKFVLIYQHQRVHLPQTVLENKQAKLSERE
jgi:hypothetical protein